MQKNIKIRNNIEIQIDYDEDSDNPILNHDDLKIRLTHKKLNFVDNLKDKYDFSKCQSFKEEVELVINKETEKVFYIDLYNHSCLRLTATEEYSTAHGWDNGLLGYIIAPKDITLQFMQSILKDYNQWLNGEVYSVIISEIKYCECCNHEISRHTVKSCGGFYDEDSIMDFIDDTLGLTPEEYKQVINKIQE